MTPPHSLILFLVLLGTGCATRGDLKQDIVSEFGAQQPVAWGERLPGVKTRLKTQEKVVALTLDACGSEDDGFDADLIDFLEAEKIPATLFINSRWIDRHPAAFEQLIKSPWVEIENHGTRHQPASVTGRNALKTPGTANAAELYDEIETNARRIENYTGRKPRFYRSGTAYYDDVALRIIARMGYEAIGFNARGDKGVTRERDKISERLLAVEPGSIVLLHMHRPERATFEGAFDALPVLRARGFRFVFLKDFPLE